MGGLDYLNKKVWHPGSMKNIQKVWQQEQKQRQINKKQKERAKKLQQERHNQELKRIQVEAGILPRSHIDRMQWMYDWGNKVQQQKTNQEYLTGQKKADPHSRKQFKHIFQEQVTNNKCEDFALLHEDPLFEIQKSQKERKDAIINNPIMMKKIIKEVEADYFLVKSEIRERDKKRNKKSKKHKKSKRSTKYEQNNKSSSDSSKSSSRSSRQRSRSRRKANTQKYSHDSQKKPYQKSQMWKQYIQQRFGGIVKQEEDGSLKVNYGVQRRKYKTQFQLDEEDRKNKLEAMRNNAKLLQKEKQLQRRNVKHQEQKSSKEIAYQEGINNIRQKMYATVRQNRNLHQYKLEEYERQC